MTSPSTMEALKRIMRLQTYHCHTESACLRLTSQRKKGQERPVRDSDECSAECAEEADGRAFTKHDA